MNNKSGREVDKVKQSISQKNVEQASSVQFLSGQTFYDEIVQI